jgi:LPS-assembly lipoprotein
VTAQSGILRLGRRCLLGCSCAVASAGLAGCGFRPVYGDQGNTASASAQHGLAAISVAISPERAGQQLRQALQERFERFGAAVGRRYELRATFAVTDDAIAVQQDSSVTRIRIIGYAQYTLTSLDASRKTLTSGSARRVDGYDVINQQFFAADLEQESVVGRLANSVADQIAIQLAVFFDRQPAA